MTDLLTSRGARPTADQQGRPIDWKFLFNQLFALEIKKEHVLPQQELSGDDDFDELLRAYTQYSPRSFNDALQEISKAETAEEAYEARRAFFENPSHRAAIASLDLDRCVTPEIRQLEGVQEFLDTIEKHRDRPIKEEENFFDSPEGRSLCKAFRWAGGETEQEVAFVLVPGYGAHTIKFPIFEEILRDANEFHQRPPLRPLLFEDGIDLEFEDHATYYGRSDEHSADFDILHPAGKELGNTTGFNAESTDALYRWIQSFPPAFQKKKLIFLGYSKGAPVVLDLVNRHPELSSRILGYVTFAGVVQGTHVARQTLEQADNVLRDVPISTFIDTVREREPTMLGRVLSPLFADVDLSWLSLPRIRAVFDILGHDISKLEAQVDKILAGREVRELLDGAWDLSPRERVRWNLKHFNNEVFQDDAFIFNLSGLTDVKDFVRPAGLRARQSGGSLLSPVFDDEGELDWTQLSLDALFLYVTSLEGFRSAPGGLFDTQVELPNTKTMFLDRRPLAESLTDEEIRDLWADEEIRALLESYDVMSRDELARRPRCDLIPAERWSHLDPIDLGEFKGHHWSLFIQALRPPEDISTTYARWDFPRKAFMRALLQVMALRNLVRQHRLPGAGDKRHQARGSLNGNGAYRDVVFYRTYGADVSRQQMLNLSNLAARAVSYGLVVNSARTGLGTAPPVGSGVSKESLYYQAVRLYSYFDLTFGRRLLRDPGVWPLPQSLAAVVGHFPASFATSYRDEHFEQWTKVRRALRLLAPRLPNFDLRRLGPGDYSIEPGSRQVSFSQAIRDNLWQGTEAKLAAIERHAYRPDAADVYTKLEAMLGAFTPLSTVFAAVFDGNTPAQSYTRLAMYLPAYHRLHAEDLDFPKSWYLEKGLEHYSLTRPVQISAAEITALRYLGQADLSRRQAIKLEIRRDFEDPDRVTSIASFGHLFESSVDELCGFDSSDPSEALYVVFRPRLALDDDESPADRAVKEAYNLMFGGFEVEARIHQLSLSLRRGAVGALAAPHDDAVLRPRFSLNESKISFRVHRYVDTTVERLPLLAAGFTCSEGEGGHRFHCWRDFWTWDHFRDEFFSGRSLGTGKLSLPEHLRERLLEQLVGSATRVIIDRSIGSIEDAIDGEIGRIAEDYLKRYSKARSVLTDRLHDGLF